MKESGQDATSRLERSVHARIARRLPPDAPGFAIRINGSTRSYGDGEPGAILVVRDPAGLAAVASMDVTRIAEAYRDGTIDVDGDVQRLLALRAVFRDFHPATWAWRFIRPLVTGQQASDASWIAEHYDYDAAFYQLFLDQRHRCYSQAVFEHAGEPLECAQTRKLEFALDAIQARSGDRVLDIGGGWGSFVEFGGQRGLRVTSLTISRQSESFIQALIDSQHLPCRVVREHLFAHEPVEPYDAIVNLGVTEHLPDYRATLAKYGRLLKPGGRVYLDASAGRRRHRLSAFFLRHIFPGNGTVMCLHKYLAAVSSSPFELLAVHNDRLNYQLTTRHWALNLDRHADEIVRRWGGPLYRTFRLYLWGCVDGFERDVIQAYRVVLRLPEEA